MIEVPEIVNDPDFAQEFNIARSSGTWTNGKFVVASTANIDGYGTITVATPRDLEMVPPGDVVHGAMVFHSQQPIYATRNGANGPGFSDILTWHNLQWRVLTVGPYSDYGYYRAIATRLSAV